MATEWVQGWIRQARDTLTLAWLINEMLAAIFTRLCRHRFLLLLSPFLTLSSLY